MIEYQIFGCVLDDSMLCDVVSNYWCECYIVELYYDDQLFFEDYELVYWIGYVVCVQDMICVYEQVEVELELCWVNECGYSCLEWMQVCNVVCCGWEDV